jgi:hypothetical protein
MVALAGLQATGMLLNAFLLVGKVSETGERLLPLTPIGLNNLLVKSGFKITFLADMFESVREPIVALLLAGASGWMILLVMHVFRPRTQSST